METPTLWEKLPADDLTDESLEARFQRWVRANPRAVESVIEMSERMFANGHRRVSMRDMFGWMRVERLATRAADEEYALNNSYASRLSRLVMDKSPHLNGLFEVRELKS